MTLSAVQLRVDGERLWGRHVELAQIGALPGGGCNRPAASDLDAEGRALVARWCLDLGCQIEHDEIGNMFARLEGEEPSLPLVLTGSHLDTQPTGGKFDGVFGVLAAVEVMATLAEAGLRTRRSIEVVVWTNEEGARFQPACIGSAVLSGDLPLERALAATDAAGLELGAELARTGQLGSRAAKPVPIRAALEAHIEQGPILEKVGRRIGVVAGVIGLRWYDVILHGVEAHAGPTPMQDRVDPWRAALPVIEAAYAAAALHSPWARCTIGNLKVSPGARNTVPRTLTISVDLRHPDEKVLETMDCAFRAAVDAICDREQIAGEVREVWHMPATSFDPACVDVVRRATTRLGLESEEMFSGAGHDSVFTARFAPTAMIFVPCKNGLSHNEAEYAAPGDLEAGANVLLHAILEIAEPIS